MKRTKCQYGAAILISLLVAVGAVNLVPGSLLIESSSTTSLLDASIPSDINETLVLSPPPLSVSWGWKGNFTFTYLDVANDTGIENATVLCEIWSYTLNVTELDNGTYMVELDTTSLPVHDTSLYYLMLTFQKHNYQTQVATVSIRVLPVPTEVSIQVPESNGKYSVTDLIVPIGDSLDIRFQYNDTDSSDGYVGGVPGAYATANLYGPTLVRNVSELNDLGNGTYSYLFDTTESWLFEATGGVPFVHELPYLLDVIFELENHDSYRVVLRVFIVEVPTEMVIVNSEDCNYVGPNQQFSITFYYMDTWPEHHDAPISDATVLVEIPDPSLLEVVQILQDPVRQGIYNITLLHITPKDAPGGGCCPEPYTSEILTISIQKDGHEKQTHEVSVSLYGEGGGLPSPNTAYGVPLLILLFVTVVAYSRRIQKREQIETAPVVDGQESPLEKSGPNESGD
jgi:hypothetical protein